MIFNTTWIINCHTHSKGETGRGRGMDGGGVGRGGTPVIASFDPFNFCNRGAGAANIAIRSYLLSNYELHNFFKNYPKLALEYVLTRHLRI